MGINYYFNKERVAKNDFLIYCCFFDNDRDLDVCNSYTDYDYRDRMNDLTDYDYRDRMNDLTDYDYRDRMND